MYATSGTTPRQSAKRTLVLSVVAVIVLGLVFALAMTSQAQAASFSTKAKPKLITKSCSYTNGKVTLKWKKIKGATKYIVYRSTKKGSSYKKFKTVKKKTTLTKKSVGEYYFKIRAFKGKKKSKYSKPVHLFSAWGNYFNIFRTSFNFGGGRTAFNAAISNESKKTMTFKKSSTYTIQEIDKKSGKVVTSWDASIGDENCTIAKGKEGMITISTSGILSDPVEGHYYNLVAPFKAGGKTFKVNIMADHSTVLATTK